MRLPESTKHHVLAGVSVAVCLVAPIPAMVAFGLGLVAHENGEATWPHVGLFAWMVSACLLGAWAWHRQMELADVQRDQEVDEQAQTLYHRNGLTHAMIDQLCQWPWRLHDRHNAVLVYTTPVRGPRVYGVYIRATGNAGNAMCEGTIIADEGMRNVAQEDGMKIATSTTHATHAGMCLAVAGMFGGLCLYTVYATAVASHTAFPWLEITWIVTLGLTSALAAYFHRRFLVLAEMRHRLEMILAAQKVLDGNHVSHAMMDFMCQLPRKLCSMPGDTGPVRWVVEFVPSEKNGRRTLDIHVSAGESYLTDPTVYRYTH